MLVSPCPSMSYDEKSMFLATYDWRLPLDQLEERDAFFSGLMTRIELMVRSNSGRTAVVISHSITTGG